MVKSRFVLIAGAVFVVGAGLFFVLNKNRPRNVQTSKTQPTNTVSEKREIRVGNNTCDEFSKEWVAKVTGKTIIKTEAISGAVTDVCQYYVDANNFLTLRLNNLSFENQKKGQQTLERTIITNDRIKMEHFIAVQANGLINGVYLAINPNQFLVVDRTSTKALSEEEIVNFAKSVADKIQGNESAAFSEPIEKNEAVVPLPQEEDIIRSFFEIIGENRPSDAISMMSQKLIGDESSKQAWGVQFNAFKTVRVEKIEPSMQANWTENNHSYQVILNVQMKPEAANAPIPYYGWGDNPNTRFINLTKTSEGIWKVDEIATGP